MPNNSVQRTANPSLLSFSLGRKENESIYKRISRNDAVEYVLDDKADERTIMAENVIHSGHLACLSCGTTNATEARFVACGSQTFWKIPEKHPVIPTTSTIFREFISHWEQDDIKIWNIALCGRCQAKCSKDYFQKQVDEAHPWLTYGPLAIVAFFVFGFIADRFFRPPGLFTILIFFALFVAAFLLFPTFAFQYFRSSRNLRLLNKSDSLLRKRKDDAYIGAADKLLKKLQNRGSPHPLYPLPVFKYIDEYPEKTRKDLEKFRLRKSDRSRTILGVAETREQLLSSLSEDWRKLLDM